MMHEEIIEQLSEYRDRTLTDADRIRVEQHLADCGECRAVLADIERVVAGAAALGPMQPPRDLWSGIASRIAAEAAPANAGDDVIPITRSASVTRRFSFTAPQLAAAAAVLALAAAGAARLVPQLGAPAPAPTVAADATGDGAFRLAAHVELSYEPTIRQLEEILVDAEEVLDPETVTVLRRSLAAIDAAIDDARTALEADPANAYLSRHLDGAMRRKVDLLRQASRLVART